MDCIVDFYGILLIALFFGCIIGEGIWFLGYLVSVSVLYVCKCYCSILLYQTLL